MMYVASTPWLRPRWLDATTPNNTLERTVNNGGRIVLAMDCVLADAQWRWCPAAQLDR